jgi:hypothetical protein
MLAHRMRTALVVALLVLPSLEAGVPRAQEAPARNPQKLCFVGDRDAPRTAAFVAFLRERFASVEVMARGGGDVAAMQRADVVLLDWPQGDEARSKRAAGWSPLGPREDWRTPAVLLGSAGLNLAGAWQVRGGFG